MQKKCCKCKKYKRAASCKYCLKCKAAYMRSWRKNHPMLPSQKMKDNARSYAHQYKIRGKIKIQPCEICGTTKDVQMHHPDYSSPTNVKWLCKTHHRQRHKKENIKSYEMFHVPQ